MSTACIAHKTATSVTLSIAMIWALVALGCGGDGGGGDGGASAADSGASAAAGVSGGGSQAGGGSYAGGAGAAGTAGMDGQLPDTSVECEEDAIPCRGECFREVGEAHNPTIRSPS